MNKMIKLGKYQHSKTGKQYQVIGIAKHSETGEALVIYESLYEHPESKYWVRPAKMFEEKVEINGKQVPRFTYISE